MRKEAAKKDKAYKLKILPLLTTLHRDLRPDDAFETTLGIFETLPGFALEAEYVLCSGADNVFQEDQGLAISFLITANDLKLLF